MLLSRTLEKFDESKKESCKRTNDFLNWQIKNSDLENGFMLVWTGRYLRNVKSAYFMDLNIQPIIIFNFA